MAARRARRPPGRYALHDLPARVVTFLRAIGQSSSIRSALEAGGYGADEHARGQALLLAACPYTIPGLDPADDLAARAASTELLLWARSHLTRLRAALRHLHPEHARYFAPPDVDGEGEAVLACASIFEWVSSLDPSSPVAVTLARRGLDATELARLRSVVATAQHAAPVAEIATSGGGAEGAASAPLVALYAWYKDWSTTARSLVKRRDLLIRLGLARRRLGEARPVVEERRLAAERQTGQEQRPGAGGDAQ